MFEEGPAFLIVATELRDEVYKIGFIGHHRSTMAKRKHPRDMTNDEAIRHLFHPKVVKHVKALVEKRNAVKPSKKATKQV